MVVIRLGVGTGVVGYGVLLRVRAVMIPEARVAFVGGVGCRFPCLPLLSALLVEAESQGRASGLAVRVSSSSIESGWLSIMCGRRGVFHGSLPKASRGWGRKTVYGRGRRPDFQGFGIFHGLVIVRRHSSCNR